MGSYGGFTLLVDNMKKTWNARQPSGILCHRYKFIYFPIPKAANSSMRTMIAEAEGLPITGKPHQLSFEWVLAKELDDYPDYRRVVVVRNPWSRIFACYNNKIYWLHKDDGEIVRRRQLTAGFARYNRLLRRELFHPDMSFAEFVRIVARIPDAFSDRHFRSQHKSFCHSDGTPLVDSFIWLEQFNEGMQEFLSSVGADDVEIRYLNRGRKSEFEKQFDDELADIVARRYRRDIELLQYRRPRCLPARTSVEMQG